MKKYLLVLSILFTTILNAQEYNYCNDIDFHDASYIESTVIHTPSVAGVIIFKNVIKNKKTFYTFRAPTVSESYSTKNNNLVIHFEDGVVIKKINQDISRRKESYGYVNSTVSDINLEDLKKLRGKLITKIEVSNGFFDMKKDDALKIREYTKCLMDN